MEFCSICDTMLLNTRAAKLHSKNHTKTVCDECPKEFKSRRAAHNHKKLQHSKVEEKKNEDAKETVEEKKNEDDKEREWRRKRMWMKKRQTTLRMKRRRRRKWRK